MPAPDLSAIAKWPNVPACYGWLALDRRGGWRIRGEPVVHGGLVAFLNRQYGCDDAGRWFVQNGPQRVFVALAYTPWVWRLAGDGSLVAHTGEAAGAPSAVFLDEEGSVLVAAELGIGLLDDRDLPAFAAACRGSDGTAGGEAALMGVMAGEAGVTAWWQGLAVSQLSRTDIPTRFRFQPDPAP